MLAFARETRLSETSFVQTATAEGADYRNRIWTIPVASILGPATTPASRREARQLVKHGHFKLNGQKADIPSMNLRKGDTLEGTCNKR